MTGSGAYGALTPGRVDQGVDFGGSGPVRAVADGVIKSVGLWNGWPGTGGVVYSIAKGRNVFVQESFAPSVRPGQHVKAGEIIGRATGGSTGIETGWANAAGTTPLVRYNGLPDGTPTAGGKAFQAFLKSGNPGSAPAGGGGALGFLDPTGGPLDPGGGPLDPSSSNFAGGIPGAIAAIPGQLFDKVKGAAMPAFLTVVLVFGGLALLGLGATRGLGGARAS